MKSYFLLLALLDNLLGNSMFVKFKPNIKIYNSLIKAKLHLEKLITVFSPRPEH